MLRGERSEELVEPDDPVSMKVEQTIDDVIARRRPQPTSLREIER